MSDALNLSDAAFYFHEVSPQMLFSEGFPAPIKRGFSKVFYDEFYAEKYMVFAAFDHCRFAILYSFSEFSPCDLTDLEIRKILDICNRDRAFSRGSPTEINLDRLYKWRSVPA